MKEFSLAVETSKPVELIPITDMVNRLIRENGLQSGWLQLFVPHTTAAVTVNEQADPDVAVDLEEFFRRISPDLSVYRHLEGNSSAHALSSLVGVSLLLIMQEGRLRLGRWQGLFFCEFDGPRKRSVLLSSSA